MQIVLESPSETSANFTDGFDSVLVIPSFHFEWWNLPYQRKLQVNHAGSGT